MNTALVEGPKPEVRTGLSVAPHEVVSGDQLRDRGVIRTVVYAVRPADRSQTVRIHLEPMWGHDTYLQVPNGETIYVRRVCAELAGGQPDRDGPAPGDGS
jgi:hypothetical protein